MWLARTCTYRDACGSKGIGERISTAAGWAEVPMSWHAPGFFEGGWMDDRTLSFSLAAMILRLSVGGSGEVAVD